MPQSRFWWFVFVNDQHVRTYGTRHEAMADMERHAKDHPTDRVRVDRGTRRVNSIGGGYFIVGSD